MRKRKRLSMVFLAGGLLLAGTLLVLVLAVAPIAAELGSTSASYDLSWDVIASGGTTMSSSSYSMLSTSGQSVVGEASSSSNTLLSGYWHGVSNFIYEVLLPLIET